jgi:hypothetical protein
MFTRTAGNDTGEAGMANMAPYYRFPVLMDTRQHIGPRLQKLTATSRNNKVGTRQRKELPVRATFLAKGLTLYHNFGNSTIKTL